MFLIFLGFLKIIRITVGPLYINNNRKSLIIMSTCGEQKGLVDQNKLLKNMHNTLDNYENIFGAYRNFMCFRSLF